MAHSRWADYESLIPRSPVYTRILSQDTGLRYRFAIIKLANTILPRQAYHNNGSNFRARLQESTFWIRLPITRSEALKSGLEVRH
jgi:hypothetical protein